MPSGIPDFRTPGKGLWEKVDPMEVAHIDAFRRDPDALLALLRRSASCRCATSSRTARTRSSPSSSAAALIRGVITQNIDRLHRAAGTAAT